MDREQIELVLPLKPSNQERGSDFRRAMNGLITSLEVFCDPAFVRCLSIIVPSSGQAQAEELAKATKLPVSVIIEDDLLPVETLRGLPRSGWYIQQMLKMQYSKTCSTAYYLTLDADVVLARPMDRDIVADGRFPIQHEPAAAHREWWTTSAGLLRLVKPIDLEKDRVFGVTPGFINAAVMRRTLDRLDFVARQVGAQEWVSYLAQNTNLADATWTEYSLYWSILTNIESPDRLYYSSRVYDFHHSVNDIDVETLRRPGGGPPLFLVVQSSCIDERDHAYVCERLFENAKTSNLASKTTASMPPTDGPFLLTPDLTPFGRKVFSQNDEDGIFEELARAMKIEAGSFVEFGVGPPHLGSQEKDGLEANCRLLHERGWRGLWMDGSPSTPLVKQEFITALNINELLAKHGFDHDVDVFSIDVDGQDFWIWMNLAIRPKIVVVEYNCDFDPDDSKVVPFDLNFRWDCTRYMGASLHALCKLAASKAYLPVYANGINAFFVRGDLVSNKNDFPQTLDKPRARLHKDDPLGRPWTTV